MPGDPVGVGPGSARPLGVGPPLGGLGVGLGVGAGAAALVLQLPQRPVLGLGRATAVARPGPRRPRRRWLRPAGPTARPRATAPATVGRASSCRPVSTSRPASAFEVPVWRASQSAAVRSPSPCHTADRRDAGGGSGLEPVPEPFDPLPQGDQLGERRRETGPQVEAGRAGGRGGPSCPGSRWDRRSCSCPPDYKRVIRGCNRLIREPLKQRSSSAEGHLAACGIDGPRSGEQRRAAPTTCCTRHADAWVASASTDGEAHLVPLSYAWDGTHLILATDETAMTTRNIRSSGAARLRSAPRETSS